ncbi:hypothetical protein MKJ04_03715 [Pontibacter sp. E15-1]|uniref:ligand-binding sensor domain-containing protein n=1 Tax=Pontibacter sp. E15-1 TaxID=2919918 RepID=UPI001F4F6BF3|nr:two-component regulator propeller domain-containing protein [Pontibacter sp. E15-1]MCJ8163935.1 hypothetical protein [Pontibacter sp. E15-1]
MIKGDLIFKRGSGLTTRILVLMMAFLTPSPFAQVLLAQNPQSFITIDKLKNLTGESVTSIIQDKEGFIWIGTKSGLIRYDGYTQKVFSRSSSGLSNDDVSAVYIDSKDRMWVGTIDGLSLFNRKTDRFTNFRYSPNLASTLSSKEINTVFEDSGHTIWIGTEKGLNRFVEADSSFVRYAHKKSDSPSLNYGSVKSIFEDTHKKLWIGTFGGGLLEFDREKEEFRFPRLTTSSKDANSLRYINVIRALNTEELLLGTSNEGLLIFNPGTSQVRPFFCTR